MVTLLERKKESTREEEGRRVQMNAGNPSVDVQVVERIGEKS